jgi:ADP-ribose pyrophosphatase YjhB (NUDIX family)
VPAICYAARKTKGKIKTTGDEEDVKFFKTDSLREKLAFDHARMIKDYMCSAKPKAV